MFYLFLAAFGLSYFYFIRNFNQILFHHAGFNLDILLAAFCVLLSLFLVNGSMHIKHVNSELKKKFGYGIIIFGIGFFLAFAIRFNLVYFIEGLEVGIVFVIIGFFVIKYQEMPEGEPDVKIDENEEEQSYFDRGSFSDFSSGYVPEESFSQTYDEFTDRPKENPELTELKELLEEISEYDLNKEAEENIKQSLFFTEKIQSFDYDFNEDLISAIIQIYTEYKLALENNYTEEIDKINGRLPEVTKGLENIYQDVHGGQVYRVQKNIIAFSKEISDNS